MADDGGGGGAGMGVSTQEKDENETYDDAVDRTTAELNSGGGGTNTKSVKDPLVYMGSNDYLRGEMGLTASTGYYDNALTLSTVQGQYYDWDQGTKDKFLSQLNLAGYDANNMKDGELAGLWAQYAMQSASYYREGRGAKVTPWDILAKDMKAREAYMNTPRTVTQTQKSVDLSSRGDAKAIFLQAAQQLLGRDPTKSEVTAFQKSLNAYEKKNPTVSTTTSNYIGDTLKTQNTTTSGGVKEGTRGVMASEKAKADPEFGAYQAATTYFDAMMQMIGG